MSADFSTLLTRRALLSDMGLGIGGIALATLLNESADAKPLSLRPPHFAPRAKNVIFLFAGGGVSQLDTFDPKPELKTRHGQVLPDELAKGERFAFINPKSKLLGSPYEFKEHGDCGMVFSELLPNLARLADKTTLIRSMQTDNVNHGPAQELMATGFERQGRPSMGAWVTYGLGSENSNLPAFVDLPTKENVIRSPLKAAGFLPSVYQAITLRPGSDPVYYLSDPAGMSRLDRRSTIDAINDLNRERLAVVGDPEIDTRIAQYELAFRMQAAVPELLDLSGESKDSLFAYGIEDPGKPSLARNLLLARRLVERGVRFVQLRDEDWDHHDKIFVNLPKTCASLDRPLAALIFELEQRGLLEETLVIWAGEFGRTPMVQGRFSNKAAGRDHHKHAFTIWMAGGGLKPGLTYGATDELGYHVTENPVHVHDLQATILYLLGLDHVELTYRHAGRDHRLTDEFGEVKNELLA